jgi:uncharacterized caspase-like protein
MLLVVGMGYSAAQSPDTRPEVDSHGLGHLDEPRARELAQLPGEEASARVAGTEDRWQSSGVMVRAGQSYRIEASGEWSAGALCNNTGPAGNGAYTLLCFPSVFFPTIVPGPSHSMLIAKIGRDGRPFAVGDRHEVVPERDGVLYFRMNDTANATWDNRGHLTARVRLAGAAAAAAPPRQAGVASPPARAPEVPVAIAPVRQPEAAAPVPAVPAGARAQYWAIVIGVSDYADSRIPPLRYAGVDARAFHDWLVSPDGGRYAPSRTRLLLDREATAANIKDALYTWLRQAIEEDIVVIYFAGHGSPDSPDSPQNLYLLPHDTRYDSIAATGFPMWDIETALKRFIKARRVIVIADACHSGGVGASFDIARRSTPEANRISRGFQNLSSIGEGIAVLSASDDKQGSAEGAQFGGGHGAFTWFLLNGVRGEADYNRDGRVTLGELIPYLSEQVRRATGNAQSPTVAGRFDPALSIGR